MEAALKKVKHNKLTYRLHANRKINGSKNHEATVRKTEKNRLSVGFRHKARSIMEDGGSISIFVERKGGMNMTAMIDYRTEDETAFGNRDYDTV